MRIKKRNILFYLLIAIIIIYLLRRNQKPLTAEQEEKIKQMHPDVQNDFRNFVREIEEKTQYKVLIVSTWRGWAKSWEIYNTNESVRNCCPVGYDYHFYAFAADITLIGPQGSLSLATPAAVWESTGIREIARKYKMRWGIDFPGYYDPVHFDKPLYSVQDLANRTIEKYGTLENAPGNRVNTTELKKQNYNTA